MFNLIYIVLLTGIACFLYESDIKPFFQKRKIKKFESYTARSIGYINQDMIVNDEEYKNNVSKLWNLYKSINFRNDQIVLRLEIIKFMCSYVVAVNGLITQHGIQLTAFNSDDANGTDEKIAMLEIQKGQLEVGLNSILAYIKQTEGGRE